MKNKQKAPASACAGLVLLLLQLVYTTPGVSQPKPWSTLEDIRQVTEMAKPAKWETLKQEKGVNLSSRWLSFGDSVKTREIASHFVVHADVQSVIANLVVPHQLLEWNDGARSFELLRRDSSTWITHTVYDIPYPFAQQDLVVKNVMVKENKKIIILMSALPDYIAPVRNVTRQQLYFGKWELISRANGTTMVKFSAVSFSRSSVPRFIRDPIIQNKLFNSFVRLRELSSI